MSYSGKWRRPFFWAALIIIVDLATKAAARHCIFPGESIAVIPGFFDLVLTFNTGAAFGIFSNDGGPGQGFKMAALAALSLAPFLYFYFRAAPHDRVMLTSLGLIWGGALGNIHDRFRWGAVVDFLDFHLAGRHWPAFNAADMAICLGAALLLIRLWREKP